MEIVHPSVTVNAMEHLKYGTADVISLFLVTALTARSEGIEMVNITQFSQHSAIMMHRGQIVEDFFDDMKRRVRVPDLMHVFDRVQKRELFDQSVADMLKPQYC